MAGPCPLSLISLLWAWEFAFLIDSQVILMLLVQGPHIESHCHRPVVLHPLQVKATHKMIICVQYHGLSCYLKWVAQNNRPCNWGINISPWGVLSRRKIGQFTELLLKLNRFDLKNCFLPWNYDIPNSLVLKCHSFRKRLWS